MQGSFTSNLGVLEPPTFASIERRLVHFPLTNKRQQLPLDDYLVIPGGDFGG